MTRVKRCSGAGHATMATRQQAGGAGPSMAAMTKFSQCLSLERPESYSCIGRANDTAVHVTKFPRPMLYSPAAGLGMYQQLPAAQAQLMIGFMGLRSALMQEYCPMMYYTAVRVTQGVTCVHNCQQHVTHQLSAPLSSLCMSAMVTDKAHPSMTVAYMTCAPQYVHLSCGHCRSGV